MTIKIALAIVICFVVLPCVLGFNPSKYTNSKQITPQYKLYWKMMPRTQEIALGFEVATPGWFGFGIAEFSSGSMPGSDVVVIQKNTTNNGSVYISDRYTTAFALPIVDSCAESDWLLVSGETKNGMTYVELIRPLAARDDQDRTITPGDNAIIVAWGNNTSIGYHGANRLATFHCFFDCPNDNATEVSNSYVMDIKMPNISLPTQKTTYMCYAVPFTTPNNDDVHVVRLNFVPLSNIDNAVHHMVLHLCEDFSGQSLPSVPSLYSAQPTDCTDPNPSPLGYPGCSVLYSWARGGRAMNLPEEAGFRIRSTSNSSKYLVLDMHYNNPNLIPNVIDGSGIEMVATTELRTYDASTMILGDPAVLLPDIPANQSAWHVELTCPTECTSTFTHDIHVFADYFHMHEIGKTGYSVIHRGNETITLNRVEYYQFANQHAVPVNLTLKPGDRINTNCVWDSSSRTKPTNMYIASTDEMCMEFMTYYPALPDVPLCGYYQYNKMPITVCGRDGIPIPNPSVVDVPSAVNRTFGTADSVYCVPRHVSSGPITNAAGFLMALIMACLLL